MQWKDLLHGFKKWKRGTLGPSPDSIQDKPGASEGESPSSLSQQMASGQKGETISKSKIETEGFSENTASNQKPPRYFQTEKEPSAVFHLKKMFSPTDSGELRRSISAVTQLMMKHTRPKNPDHSSSHNPQQCRKNNSTSKAKVSKRVRKSHVNVDSMIDFQPVKIGKEVQRRNLIGKQR